MVDVELFSTVSELLEKGSDVIIQGATTGDFVLTLKYVFSQKYENVHVIPASNFGQWPDLGALFEGEKWVIVACDDGVVLFDTVGVDDVDELVAPISAKWPGLVDAPLISYVLPDDLILEAVSGE